MKAHQFALALGLLAVSTVPAQARTSFDAGRDLGGSGGELAAYLECVPYARAATGIDIYGDAHTWWQQAEGRYKRGSTPKAGAVMTFRPTGALRHGHVAAVSQVIDSRTVLLDHANWSPIGGRRGQVERGVKAVDVSPANDWSAVRVWYDPLGDVGTTHWPVLGFIYGDKPSKAERAAAARPAAPPAAARPGRSGDTIADIIAGNYR
jgi:surface antigen